MKNNDSEMMMTIRVLMVGKEIGGIIGKGGSVIASFREKSGAKINIPSAHQGNPERIVTVTGHQSQIKEAFKLIAEKLEKDMNSSLSSSTRDKVPVTLKLIVPASQCGSIIGRGGSKIKEIRDTSACSIQVQSDMLPFSTERAVTLNGSPSSIVHCVDMLCDVMIQFPAKTATVPYKPQPSNPPVIFHHGQAYMLQGSYAVPHPDIAKLRHLAAMHSYTEDSPGGLLGNFTSLMSPEKGSGKFMDDMDKGASGTFNLPTKIVDAGTQEITVPNEVIGCIIGKGGSRINEIRTMSDAQISIDRSLEKDSKKERTITISGTPEAISLAQYLINTSIQLFSHQNKPTKSSSCDEGPSTSAPKPLMSLPTAPSCKPIPISQLLGGFMGSGPFGGAGLAGAYPGPMGMGPGASFSAAMQSARQMFMNRSRYSGNFHSNRTRHRRTTSKKDQEPQKSDGDEEESANTGDISPNGKEKRKSKREKFQPY